MAIEKFFTIVGGVIGTAHIGRDGRLNDFRPATVESPRAIDGFFRLIPMDGWTDPLRLIPTVAEPVFNSSEDGEWVITIHELSAEFRGVALSTTVSFKNLTELGKQLNAQRQNAAYEQRLAERQALKEREPSDRDELEAWLDARLADPLMGGRMSAGTMVRKPTRARWAVGNLIEAWLKAVPLLAGNQFALRKEVFVLLQKRSGSTAWGAGGRLVQQAVLRAVEAKREERKAAWLARQTKE